MERWVKRAIELGAGIIFKVDSDPSVIPYYPQKTEVSGYERRYFHRTSPEKKGVLSGRLVSMIDALEKERGANVHSLLCLKGGEVICECAHPGYETGTWHLSHSMSKTVTGMAIGMLVDDGKLTTDTHLIDIFPEIPYNDRNFESITVEHLLTMTAGVGFSEAGSVTESAWTEAYFASLCSFEPGTAFLYNSMNSYILAATVVRIAGVSLTDFLDERLFGPLHIVNRFWEVSAEGIEKGGWGLYLSAESWAKIGYMMLRGGVFEGKRILSQEWIKASCLSYATSPERTGHYDYGYHLWTSPRNGCCLFNGMLGQNVWICPRNDLVVVVTSGNNELFQNSPARLIIEEYLLPDLSSDLVSSFDGDITDLRRKEKHFFEGRHMIRPYKPRRGLGYRLGLKSMAAYPPEWENLVGKYSFPKNNASILPLIVRVMQNNLYGSLDGVEFECNGGAVFFTYTEGDVSYRLEVGFADFKETVIDFHGEKYIVKVIGEAMEDEDRNMLYKLEVLFPEMPNTRIIKLSFTECGGLMMRLSEIPNERIADELLSEINGSSPRLSTYMKLIERRFGKNAVKRRIADTFAPTLVGARIGTENYHLIMECESERMEQQRRNVKMLDALIKKLLRDEEDTDGQRGFIGELVNKMKLKTAKKDKNDADEST